MDQLLSGRPANASRRARRSLAEFALPANDALREITSAAPPLLMAQPVLVTRLNKQPFKAPNKTIGRVRRGLIEDQNASASGPKRVHCEGAGKGTTVPATIVDECYAHALELMTTNITTTLQYAQRLLTVKTPTDLLKVSLSQANKQAVLIIEQTSTFASVAQKLTTPNVKRPVRL
jgi:hypothetical protein